MILIDCFIYLYALTCSSLAVFVCRIGPHPGYRCLKIFTTFMMAENKALNDNKVAAVSDEKQHQF